MLDSSKNLTIFQWYEVDISHDVSAFKYGRTTKRHHVQFVTALSCIIINT